MNCALRQDFRECHADRHPVKKGAGYLLKMYPALFCYLKNITAFQFINYRQGLASFGPLVPLSIVVINVNAKNGF